MDQEIDSFQGSSESSVVEQAREEQEEFTDEQYNEYSAAQDRMKRISKSRRSLMEKKIDVFLDANKPATDFVAQPIWQQMCDYMDNISRNMNNDFVLKNRLYILACIVCGLILAIFFSFSSNSKPNILWAENLNVVLERYKSLPDSGKQIVQFTMQKFYKNKINKNSPEVLTRTILFSGSNADQLVKDLNQYVMTNFHSPLFQPIPLTEKIERASLHETVRTRIGTSKSSVGVISLLGIDKMKWDAPLVLHAFCDPDTNQTGDRLNLLTLSRTSETREFCEEQSSRILTENWKHSGGNGDNIPPILSRIDFIICL